jgi:hypothetical protein
MASYYVMLKRQPKDLLNFKAYARPAGEILLR